MPAATRERPLLPARRVLHALSPCARPSGAGARRRADRSGRRARGRGDRRPATTSASCAPGPDRPRRDHRPARGRASACAAGACSTPSVRDARAVRDVRRGDRPRPRAAGGLRRVGPEGRARPERARRARRAGLNHRPEVAGGLLAEECGELLRASSPAATVAAGAPAGAPSAAPGSRAGPPGPTATGCYLGRATWRGGRAVECAGLENRYGRVPSIEGSNPSPSARSGRWPPKRRGSRAFRGDGCRPVVAIASQIRRAHTKSRARRGLCRRHLDRKPIAQDPSPVGLMRITGGD